jgi:hypothetical protein
MLKAFIHRQQCKASAHIIAIHSILKFVEIKSSKANKNQETLKMNAIKKSRTTQLMNQNESK